MTENAGERLFQIMGQISEEMILEAAEEQPDDERQKLYVQTAQSQNQRKKQDADHEENENINIVADDDANADKYRGNGSADDRADSKNSNQALWYQKIKVEKLNGYLKYLPVVACLCIVFGSAGYIMSNYVQTNSSKDMDMSGSFDGGSGLEELNRNEELYDSKMDIAMDDAAAEDESDGLAEGANQSDSEEGSEKESAAENKLQDAGDSGGSAWQKALLPIRYDAYEGPVFPLTATGDTQKLKVSRSLKGIIQTVSTENGIQPLLQVTDVYTIKNTSKHDKTLQVIYPFAATMNRAYEMDQDILQIKSQKEKHQEKHQIENQIEHQEEYQEEYQIETEYSMGESIHAYRNADLQKTSSVKDYEQIFNEQTDYQEQALTKEADWNKKVLVYTFSDIHMQEGAIDTNQPGVIGVTVKGADADILTYGFDHSFAKEDGSSNYCFFIPGEQKKLVLIVTGEQDGDPQPACYTNLDCEEKLDGIQYEMTKQEMTYANALRLCSNDAARKLRQDYEQHMFAAQLPEYMNEDAAFRVLTMISEEERFYDSLIQRYQSTELTEIFERLFGETRVVYARATVTIPAKQSIQVTTRIQKRPNEGNYMLAEETEREGDILYDFLSSDQSHLKIYTTSVSIKLLDAWQLTDQSMNLKQKREQIWKADALKQTGFIAVANGKMEDPMDE